MGMAPTSGGLVFPPFPHLVPDRVGPLSAPRGEQSASLQNRKTLMEVPRTRSRGRNMRRALPPVRTEQATIAGGDWLHYGSLAVRASPSRRLALSRVFCLC